MLLSTQFFITTLLNSNEYELVLTLRTINKHFNKNTNSHLLSYFNKQNNIEHIISLMNQFILKNFFVTLYERIPYRLAYLIYKTYLYQHSDKRQEVATFFQKNVGATGIYAIEHFPMWHGSVMCDSKKLCILMNLDSTNIFEDNAFINIKSISSNYEEPVHEIIRMYTLYEYLKDKTYYTIETANYFHTVINGRITGFVKKLKTNTNTK